MTARSDSNTDLRLTGISVRNNAISETGPNLLPQRISCLTRTPKKLPKLIMPQLESIDALKNCSVSDFILDGYESHPALKAKMAI